MGCHTDDVAVADGETVPPYVAVFLIVGVCVCGSRQTGAVALRRIGAVAGGRPCGHTYVGLAQDVAADDVALVVDEFVDVVELRTVGGRVILIPHLLAALGHVDGRLLAYLQYGLVVCLGEVFVPLACRHILREERMAVGLAGRAVLGKTAVHLHAIADDEALVVGVDACAYPYHHAVFAGLERLVVLGGLLHGILQTAEVTLVAVVGDGVGLRSVHPFATPGVAGVGVEVGV